MANDTIVALSTPAGYGALAVIRMSGPRSFNIVGELLQAGDIEKLKHREAVLLSLQSLQENEFLDKCVLLPYVGPQSYSGEDIIEISCHGGSLVPRLIIENLIAAGARLARPGEFTERAFLHGKLDLAQAESIEAIVTAASRAELRLAHHQYSGQFSQEISRVRAEIVDLLSLLELELDFSDEDVEFADREALETRLLSLRDLLTGLVSSFERSHMIRDGLQVAIVGKPNVGKSSLLNYLLKSNRAIVTAVPGTTRDIIAESVEIGDYKFVFVDTAGIRVADDVVEQEGIRRSETALQSAGVVIQVVDQESGLQREDWEVRQKILQYFKLDSGRLFLLVNKQDSGQRIDDQAIQQFGQGMARFSVSCKTGAGLQGFQEELIAFAATLFEDDAAQTSFLTTLRQKESASRALQALQEGLQAFEQSLSQEFVSSHIRRSLHELGELVGEVTTEDILGHIFSNFCIGK